MRRTDTAYLAGFFDGEGSISISLQQEKYVRIEITCSQNTPEVLGLYVRAFGGRIHMGRNCFQWKLHGSKAVAVLGVLMQFLVVKYLEAQEATQAWENRQDASFVLELIQRKKERRERIAKQFEQRF